MRRLPHILPGLVLASCLDGTAPPARDFTIAFCVSPAWAAYRNEGEPWRQLTLPSDVVRLTDRVVIARVNPGGTSLFVDHLSADQAAAAYNCHADDQQASKTIHTSVSGVDAVDQVYAMLGPSIAFRSGAGPLIFGGVPAGSQDLVAARQLFATNSMRAAGVIVRRAQDVATGAILPSLDFASAEAVAPLEHTITFTDTDGASHRGLQVDFMTATGALVLIGGMGGATTTATGWSLPPSVLGPGDLHMMNAGANTPNLVRSFLFFYRTGADRTFSLGPAPSAPIFTAPPAGAIVRANVSSQPEYPARVELTLLTADKSAYLIATREFFGGTPSTWSLDLPELEDAPGFQDAWRFTATRATWHLEVTAQPLGFRPRKDARDGDLLRTAHLSGPEVQLRPAP